MRETIDLGEIPSTFQKQMVVNSHQWKWCHRSYQQLKMRFGQYIILISYFVQWQHEVLQQMTLCHFGLMFLANSLDIRTVWASTAVCQRPALPMTLITVCSCWASFTWLFFFGFYDPSGLFHSFQLSQSHRRANGSNWSNHLNTKNLSCFTCVVCTRVKISILQTGSCSTLIKLSV